MWYVICNCHFVIGMDPMTKSQLHITNLRWKVNFRLIEVIFFILCKNSKETVIVLLFSIIIVFSLQSAAKTSNEYFPGTLLLFILSTVLRYSLRFRDVKMNKHELVSGGALRSKFWSAVALVLELSKVIFSFCRQSLNYRYNNWWLNNRRLN